MYFFDGRIEVYEIDFVVLVDLNLKRKRLERVVVWIGYLVLVKKVVRNFSGRVVVMRMELG